MSNLRFLVLCGLLVVGIAVSLAFGRLGHPFAATEYRPLAVPLSEFPMKIGEWQGEDEEVAEKVRSIAGMDRVLNRLYRTPSGDAVVFYVAYYGNRLRGLRTIYHNPTVCLKGAGWTLAGEEKKTVRGGGGAPETFGVTVYTFERVGSRTRVVNFCIIDDEVLDGPPRNKPFTLAREKLNLSRDAGYYVTVQIVPLERPGAPSERNPALEFLEEAAPHLFRHF